MKCIAAVAVALIAFAAFGQGSDDEKAIRKLEQEWIMHSGSSKADIDFEKRIVADNFFLVDYVGRITKISVSDLENMAKADPDVKSSGEINNLKIQFYGADTAIATYTGHFALTGHKDKKFDIEFDFASLDVWHKQGGQWKVLGNTNTSTKPLSPEIYKVEPSPGMPAPIS